ncbi:hypothetical protein, partial [Reichenbachiella sp. MSK19-1]|uniref:beta strand repeat-containing protein n=1 Tax=Reichenbachiella sp. MSK19-1 TaxID=1897631 RepID=UPI001314690C
VKGVLSEIPGGDYTVRITNTVTGCSNLQSFEITDEETTVEVNNDVAADVTETHLTVCEGGTGYPNGAIELNNITVAGAAATTNLEYTWYYGSSVDAAKVITDGDNIFDLKNGSATGITAVAVAGATTENIQNLNNGIYTVVVLDQNSGCEADPISVTINNNPPAAYTADYDANPALTINNSICDITVATSGLYNGQITVQPDAGVAGDYTWEWFLGSNDDTPIASASFTASATDNVLSQIPAGDYTVRLTHNTTNCSNLQSFSIIDDEVDVVIDNSIAADVIETNNTVCEDAAAYPNGSIELDDISGSGDYNFKWYYGTSVDAAKLISNNTDLLSLKGTGSSNTNVVIDDANETISNLDGGFYTVVATDRATGCVSDPITIEIENAPATIVINTVVDKDDYSCDAGTPTGAITASVTSGTTDYTIQWYKGTNTSASGTLANTATNDTDNSATGLAAGTYTAVVTDDVSKCSVSQSITIKRSTPVITLVMGQTPQTTCAPNGEAVATPQALTYTNGAPTDHTPIVYTYAWYEGQVVAGTALADTDETLEAQVAGYYTVVATETTSGCSSSPYTVEIVDDVTATEPTALISTGTNQGGVSGLIPTSCDAYGTIVADVTDNPNGANITFEWYEGSLDFADDPSAGTILTTGASLASDASASVTVSTTPGAGTAGFASLAGIPSGLYTLVMIDASTGCRSQEVFDLSFLGQQATTTIAIKHVEECPDDGEATVGLSDNIDIEYINLTGTFEDGEEVIASPSGATGIIYNNSGTTMDIATTSSVAFTPADAITGQTSGATADIDVLNDGYVDGEVDDISEYFIYLYSGSGVPADKFTTYTVDGETFPKIIDASGEAEGAEVTFTGLPAGTYTAVAREKSDPAFNPGSTAQCFSASATDEIQQRSFAPIVDSYSHVDNTICDVTFPAGGNGSITVTARKDVGDTTQTGTFAFTWYEVGSESAGDELKATESNVTTSTIEDLDPGDYIVYIDRLGAAGNTANGCQTTQTVTIQDVPEVHTITDANITHIVDCSGTGEITITDAMITDDASDYSYEWYKNAVSGTAISGESAATLSGQLAGTYFVVATHTQKGCETSAFEIEILDNSEAPTVVITLGQGDDYCIVEDDRGNGVLNWRVTGATGTYSYQWYTGTAATAGSEVTGTGITNISGSSAGASLALENIASGDYTIEVTDTSSPDETCVTTATFTVPDTTPTVTLGVDDYTIVDNANCNGTGSFEITDILEDGQSAVVDLSYDLTTDYSYVFEARGGGAHGGSIDPLTPNKLDDLSEGDYQVTITNTTSDCSSSVFFFSIDDVFELPNIVLTAKTNDPWCDATANTGDGALSVEVETAVPGTTTTAGYSFTWFRGTNTANAANNISANGTNAGTATINGSGIENLSAGTYTVVVVDTSDPNNTCESVASYTLIEDPATISITSAQYTLVDNENCNGTGSFQINSVLEDGAVVGTTADYEYLFEVQGGGAHGGTIAGADDNRLEGLSGGDYQVTITNTTSDCSSSVFHFTIDDVYDLPNIVLTAKTNDPWCDATANTGDGALSVEVETAVPGTTTTAGYSFTWFRGTNTSIAANNITANGTNRGSATINGSGIENLSAGTYTVVVVDTSDPNNTCESVASYTLIEDPATISITSAQYTLVDNENCNGTGSFQINSVLEDGAVVATTANYTFDFEVQGGGAHGGTIAGANNNRLEGLSEGDYQVTITNTTSDCSSSVFFFSIDDVFELPNIVLTAKSDDSYCDATANTGDGALSVAIENGIGTTTTTGYTFEWYRGTDTSIAANEITASTLLGSEAINATKNAISGLAAGTYTVKVIDNSSPNNTCFSEASYTLVEDPTTITITSSEFTLVDNENCDGTGSFEINSVLEDGVTTGTT